MASLADSVAKAEGQTKSLVRATGKILAAANEGNEFFQKLYGCNLDWVFVGITDYSPAHEPLFGPAMPPSSEAFCLKKADGQEVPPFVVIYQDRLETIFYHVFHELHHVVRKTQLGRSISDIKERRMEEAIATSLSPLMQVLDLRIGFGATFAYSRINRKLEKDFGLNAGYVLLRSTYEELCGYRKGSITKAICQKAEQGSLRHIIMKETLRL
jgi:hypothetical protein